MCGRFTLTAAESAVGEHFGIASSFESAPHETAPRYNIAPTQQALAIRANKDGTRTSAGLRWGLIPSWAKDATIGARLINARAETVSEKPSFRTAFKKRRCLIPADGYYEWQRTDDGKQPFRIGMEDWRVFGLAGLWEQWTNADGLTEETFTLITTTTNPLTEPIHDRMPVILTPADYQRWLDPSFDDKNTLQRLLRPYGEAHMQAVAVSTWVNNARHDDERCIQPV